MTDRMHARERLLALAVIVVIPLEFALCTRLAWRHGSARLLLGAAGVDAALLAGAVTWLAARRAGGLAALGLTPRRLVRLGLTALVLVSLAARLAGVAGARVVWGGAVALELLVFGVVALGLGRGLDGLVPAPVVAALRLELALWGAAARALRRRPIAVADGTFTTTRTSRIHNLLVAAIVLSVFELPALHLVFLRAGAGVHLAIVAVHLWAIVWLVGDRRLLAESGHRVDGDRVTIALGARWHATLARAEIASVRRIDGTRPRGALRVVPADAPNVELRLRAPACFVGPFGVRRRAAHVVLFVDEPDRFVDCLSGAAG